MDLGVDIGATKTLLALFTESGKVVREHRFPTNQNYHKFLAELTKAATKLTDGQAVRACCCAVPARVDRKRGLGTYFGNLQWLNVPIRNDIQEILNNLPGNRPEVPVYIENDGNLAGLYEAISFKDRYDKVLYLTIGTGIGKGFTAGGKIVPELADGEPGHMLIEVGGRPVIWESLVSGKALYQRYGKKASEIDDPQVWKEYSHYLALGLDEMLSVFQPDAVIIGGGVGAHFDKFGGYLKDELKKYENDMVDVPPILPAKLAEEAVIYGCYEYIKQTP